MLRPTRGRGEVRSSHHATHALHRRTSTVHSPFSINSEFVSKTYRPIGCIPLCGYNANCSLPQRLRGCPQIYGVHLCICNTLLTKTSGARDGHVNATALVPAAALSLRQLHGPCSSGLKTRNTQTAIRSGSCTRHAHANTWRLIGDARRRTKLGLASPGL